LPKVFADIGQSSYLCIIKNDSLFVKG